tara:strand:+ start:34 stop:366 length:333 start_codon:yes stop_codon:yes gene_type:complete
MSSDYKIESDENIVFIKGILRLRSPSDYEPHFDPIKKLIDTQPEVIINIKDLKQLNSSGVTSFARLILHAKKENTKITVLIDSDSYWQLNNLSCLTKLYEGVQLESNTKQ